MSNINEIKPTCPVIFFEKGGPDASEKQIFTIHCQKLDVKVECYVSTAIISMEGEWTNRTNDTLDCVFALPTPGTVMNVTLKIGADRVLTTAIVSREDATSLLKEKGTGKRDDDAGMQITPDDQNPYEQYVPELFRLPFNGVAPGDQINLTCEYLEPLSYYKKGYIVQLPLYFPAGTISEEQKWEQVVSVEVKINALTQNSQIDCWTHDFEEITAVDGTVVVTTGACKPMEQMADFQPVEKVSDLGLEFTGRDLELSYSVKSESIQAHCIRQQDPDDEKKGSMCVFITPPAQLNTTFGRAFFFLVDRSGSMVGEPFREATRALNRSLDRLRPSDKFCVCAFDHRQVYYQDGELVDANAEMLTNCKTWIATYVPERGGTTMDIPITYALEKLEKSDLMPFIVLITDGAVHNEKEICERIEQNKKMRTRFLCLGIGSYCNWFFLKMLSKLGRGFADIVVYRERIYHKMDHLLRMANTPVLTDIEIGLKGEIEIYPFPVPDLFIGRPVVVACRYESGACPQRIVVRGFNPHGDQESITSKVIPRDDLPVDKIFIKQQIDIMTADAWLNNSPKLEQKVAAVSVEANMPSNYTTTLLIETTEQKLQEEMARHGLGPEDEMEGSQEAKLKRKRALAKMKNNKKTVALLATTGTLAVVSVGVMAFGDVQATLDNIPILGGGDGVDVEIEACCDDCDACDADCDCDCDCIVM